MGIINKIHDYPSKLTPGDHKVSLRSSRLRPPTNSPPIPPWQPRGPPYGNTGGMEERGHIILESEMSSTPPTSSSTTFLFPRSNQHITHNPHGPSSQATGRSVLMKEAIWKTNASQADIISYICSPWGLAREDGVGGELGRGACSSEASGTKRAIWMASSE